MSVAKLLKQYPYSKEMQVLNNEWDLSIKCSGSGSIGILDPSLFVRIRILPLTNKQNF
jgi:hypothetical protein